LSSTPQFTGEQLAAARTQHWHQDGNALLTLEDARAWVGELGLVLFAPRAQQLAAPAASLVEATLGRVVSAASAKDAEVARGLVARLVAEGAALPLNLLGGPGDVPDFVVSAQVFSYVFTLRGDKLWKQAPPTSGANKVSPLALKVYEAMVAGNALTAAELASELGREVTEGAIVRALGELWSQLRVIPLLQQDGSGPTWELTSRRFTKQIKAGANAGQPTALSAVVSLYLGQALAATDEEIETFVSPLTARSRVRDVLHGLTAGRQLEPVVLEGKTLLYIPGALPEFPQAEVAQAAPEDAAGIAAAPEAAANDRGAERIRTFDRSRKPREERSERPYPRRDAERGRPARPFGKPGAERAGGERKSFGDRERRPFQKSGGSGARPSFARPWDEERKPRERQPEGAAEGRPERPKRTGFGGERKEFGGGRKGYSKPASGGGDRERRPFVRSDKPRFARREGPRSEGERPQRSSGFAGSERPAFRKGPRKDEGRSGDRPFRPRREEGSEARPKRSFGAAGGRPAFSKGPRRDEGRSGDRPYRPRREEGSESRPKRSFGAGGERPAFGAKEPRKTGEGTGDRPFRPKREEGFAGRPKKSFGERRERPAFGGKPSGERGARPSGPRGAGRRPGGKPGFAGKKFAGRPKFGGRPGAKKGFGAKRGDAKGGKRPRTGERGPKAGE
jgi:23S rRNA pseudouridine2605 synthase